MNETVYKKVLITGTLGQDGANMCELLLKRGGIKVFGMVRRSSNPNFVNCTAFIDHPDFQLVYGDMSDSISIDKLVKDIQPDYFINFAANSFVGCSWDMPLQVFDVNSLGVLRSLEAIRRLQPQCRFYSAGSSEEWGNVDYSPQDIVHPIKPRSPYGASKASARHIVKVYRESYDMYAVHGILFNHEGTKRGEEFVTRKISKGVARIAKAIKGQKPFLPIELGNLSSKRDWSDSEDFVEGVWLMLNQENFNGHLQSELEDAEFHYIHDGQNARSETWRTSFLSGKIKDYILSSNETHSISEFVEKAFTAAGINGIWQGNDAEQKYLLQGHLQGNIRSENGCLVKVNPKFYRPAEVELLWGDSSPIRNELGWAPKISFDKLVERMVLWDIEKS